VREPLCLRPPGRRLEPFESAGRLLEGLLLRPVQGPGGLLAIFHQEEELAEHLGQVRAVDLVDGEHVGEILGAIAVARLGCG
jgi:hypothetical protein